MLSQSTAALFNKAEMLYTSGERAQAFEIYRQLIVQILEREDVTALIPSPVPDDFPQEFLAIVWRNLLASFRESQSPFTQESCPEAYSLVFSFRPSAPSRSHPQFKGVKGQRLLKAMQITASFCLGILAWEKGDRATTAKRYKEALDVAATHPTFDSVKPGLKHLDKMIAEEVQTIKDNLRMLIQNDEMTAGKGGSRKDVLPSPHIRVGEAGIEAGKTFVVATDPCGRDECTERGVGFKRCATCKKTVYCSVECQKDDWQKHKKTH
ncbi:hypothetical protein FB45DRAFT_908277 [Roridomyces roridus]|uniref:MYND-type domain-containing protein n=1 Tax=Roridomyces roridus TaxID=1738132 RepID=A0AAD7C2K3_9AGAR|nr:hypothetical protein FB45DRAFT_908277 [Roridomyces roridus]